jgi:inosine/xanthosine triphosphate pyrophosphatase family protein
MSKIVLASNNNHKIKEFTKILNQEDFHLIPQGQLNISEVEETGLTFKMLF